MKIAKKNVCNRLRNSAGKTKIKHRCGISKIS